MISTNFKTTTNTACEKCHGEQCGDRVNHLAFCPIGRQLWKAERVARNQALKAIRAANKLRGGVYV